MELCLKSSRMKSHEIIKVMQCHEIIITSESECVIMTQPGETYQSLLSTQKEADTKIMAHTREFLDKHNENLAFIRSHSSDRGIFILTIALPYS